MRGVRQWGYKKTRERNEAIDKRNYARAALDLIGGAAYVDQMAEAGTRFLIDVSNPPMPQRQVRREASGGVSV